MNTELKLGIHCKENPMMQLGSILYTHVATDQKHVPRVHGPMLSDPEGLDRILDPEDD